MGKVILYIATSLDGYIAGKDDDISWLDPYNDVEYGYQQFFSTIGAIIEGRRTYDIEVASGWENAHHVPKIVLSRHIPERKPERQDITFINGDIAKALQKAKQVTDKNIWILGGVNVAQQFINEELVDEIIVSVVPVILGDGIRLFENIHKRISLSLIDVKKFDKGLAQLVYKISNREPLKIAFVAKSSEK